ncbi:hypothetical protein I4U23_004418 [Adineta vaga]|nr:hypothetical protein I4U23_004418 [Adineta vaga]
MLKGWDQNLRVRTKAYCSGISKLRNAGITWILPGNLIFCLSDPSINSSIVLTNFRKHLRQFIIRHSVFVRYSLHYSGDNDVFGYGLSLYARYEGWPFTPVEMFSMDRRLFTHDYLIDEQQLQDIATKEVQNANAFGNEIQFSSGTMWIRITKNDETEDLTDCICSRVCVVTVTFQYHLWYVVMQSILVSKVEIQRFLNRLFEILIVSDDVQLLCITDYINVQIHYKAGWKTYATTYSPKNLRKNVYR